MPQDTFTDVNSLGEKLREEVRGNIEERKNQKTEKLNKPTKDAQKAKTEEILIGGLESILVGVNTIVGSKVPEFRHEEEELRTFSSLAIPVLSKYVDLEASEYEEEVKLASYVIACEMNKVEAFIARKKKEKAEKQEQRALNDKDKQADEKTESIKAETED